MRSRLFRILVATVVTSSTVALAQPAERDHRHGHHDRDDGPPRDSRWEQREGADVLVDGDWDDLPQYPVAAPPTLRDERPTPRAGFVWARGRWDWKDGEWAWLDGHWERERAGYRWTEGRWELQNG